MPRALPVFLVALTAGCQTPGSLPWQTPRDPAQAEALAGLRAASSLEDTYGGVARDAVAERRMERIASDLARGASELPITCRCRLLQSNKVNAFSLPGGLIYVTQGLYERLASDDCLAAVLAHELAHIAAKDSLKPPCTARRETLVRETSADRRGARYLVAAGYRTEAMRRALQLIEDQLPEGWARIRSSAVARAGIGH